MSGQKDDVVSVYARYSNQCEIVVKIPFGDNTVKINFNKGITCYDGILPPKRGE